MITHAQYVELKRMILALQRAILRPVPGAHASSHVDGGGDDVDILNLAGYPGGTSTFLRADGAFAAPSPGGLGDLVDVKFRRKTSDTSRTNNTISDDPDLIFPVGANQVWTVEGRFLIDGDAAGDFDWSWNTPAGSTGWHSGHRLIAGIAASGGDIQTSATETLTADRTAGLVTTGTLVFVKAFAYIVTDSTPGNVALQWAQNTTDATATTLHAGSIIVPHRWV